MLCRTWALIDCHEDWMISVTFHSPADFWRGTPPKGSFCICTESSFSIVNPIVWATNQPDLAVTVEPVRVLLKPGAQPVCLMQYPIRQQLMDGLRRTLQTLQDSNIIGPCSSMRNMLVLAVPKKDGSVCLVHDLRECHYPRLATDFT